MSALPCNPDPWPLERVPRLTAEDFALVLFSLTHEALSAGDPFAMADVRLDDFVHRSWGELGLAPEVKIRVETRFATMFGVNTAPLPPSGCPGEMVESAFARWLDSPREVTFFTSGSTGTPKLCTHAEDHLRQELIGIAPLMTGCTAARVPVPLHHLYGFTFGLQLPRTLGIPILKTSPIPSVITSSMQPGDLLVGIPYLWKRVVAGKRLDGSGITLLTATAPTPPDVLLTLRHWGFRCREMFGASETGALCWRESPHVPFTLLPHFVHESRALDPSHVRRVLPDGELRTYALLDTVDWIDDGHLLPSGRKDAAVQVGGCNVFPTRIADVLREHEGVADCLVRLMREDEGDRLKAFVVPREGWEARALLIALKALCKQRLRPEECPAVYTFGPDLPRTGLGKPCDWNMEKMS